MSNTVHEVVINAAQNTDPSIKTCYKTLQSEWPEPNTFVLGVDLGETHFAHAILVVSDLDVMTTSNMFIPNAYDEKKDWF